MTDGCKFPVAHSRGSMPARDGGRTELLTLYISVRAAEKAPHVKLFRVVER